MNFCSDCSLSILGIDFLDFAGLISLEQDLDGYGAKVDCSNCGEILVDIDGYRIRHMDKADVLEQAVLPSTGDLHGS